MRVISSTAISNNLSFACLAQVSCSCPPSSFPRLRPFTFRFISMIPNTRILDEAMKKYGAKDWNLVDLVRPIYVNKSPPQIPSDLSFENFQEYVCRADVAKTCPIVMDMHIGLPEFGNIASACQKLCDLDDSGLPPNLRPAAQLPHGCTVSYIIHNQADGTMNVLCVLKFATNVKDARSLCNGQPLFPALRHGPWAWKKAIHSLFDRLPGHHAVWWSLEQKEKEVKRSSSAAWTAEEEELREGVKFVNKYSPEDDSENQQYLWILTNIRPDSGSPIAGWPEGKVIRMAQNKTRGTVGATPLTFPFTVRSLKPLMGEFIVPLIAPLLTSYGVLILGWPGVGKTPLLIVLCLALGRYHIRRLELEAVQPAWRRAKGIDNFRHKTGQIQEGLILDDPSMDRIDAADLKSWLTAEEDQNCSSRYTDVKLVRNGMRSVATNEIAEDDEPPFDNHRTSITAEEFFKLTQKFFTSYKRADVLAILKRCVVLISSGVSTCGFRVRKSRPWFTLYCRITCTWTCSLTVTRPTMPSTR